MSLVHVKDRRLHAELAQQADPADAEQDFLHDAHRAVAAINARGQIAKMLGVFRAVGVQQIDRHAPDIYAPGLKEDAVHVNFTSHTRVGRWRPARVRAARFAGSPGCSIRSASCSNQWPAGNNLRGKQSNTDEAEAEVAGGFRVVAGQDAEAAR